MASGSGGPEGPGPAGSVAAAPEAGPRARVAGAEGVVAAVAAGVILGGVPGAAEQDGVLGRVADPLLDVAGEVVHAAGGDAAGQLARVDGAELGGLVGVP